MTDSLATKQDLRELEARMDARFAAVDSRFAGMDGRFANVELLFGELEKRMTLRLGAITVAGLGVVSALLRLA